ncbi:uncharacterized protein VTP21DRAFT_789 [Calcarisporiella thermophila]|uniref:uncharacterized protein n=1 Tax=Calcarisporiella thermophila TaxID=911321 RepID=UPI00374314B2
MASLRVLRVASIRMAQTRAPLFNATRPAVRAYSTTPPEKKSNTGLWVTAGLIGAGAGYYFYSQQQGVTTPSGAKDNFKPSQGPRSGEDSKKVDYNAVYKAIADILENDEYDDGSYGPVLVRLAWHAAGTYSKHDNSGGSDGATMRFSPESGHGANKGLEVARELLDKKIKSKFPQISYADLWTLGGVVAIQEMGGPIIPWRPGRSDKMSGQDCAPDGRLPDGAKGADHIRDIFYRMGFNDQEIVALVGAHALGRCHSDRSGFEGPWTFSPTMFTNELFVRLLEDEWVEKKWKGPKQFEDKKTKSLMMLPTDMALKQDKEFRKWVEIYAKDQNRFFEDFSKAFSKLLELGVNFPKDTPVYRFKPTTE